MDNTLQGISKMRWQVRYIATLRGAGWGFFGGFSGTLIMDFILMGTLLVLRLPASTCFSVVGDTVARLFSMLNIQIASSVWLGIAIHYLVGPLIGLIFGLAVVQVDHWHAANFQKTTFLAILYVEIVSQPLLALAVILLEMSGLVILYWYAGAFVMHLLMGMILGAMVHSGLRLPVKGSSLRVEEI